SARRLAARPARAAGPDPGIEPRTTTDASRVGPAPPPAPIARHTPDALTPLLHPPRHTARGGGRGFAHPGYGGQCLVWRPAGRSDRGDGLSGSCGDLPVARRPT